MDLLNAWALLWSQSQCALHVEPLLSTLNSGRRAFAVDRRMDYVPIAIGTREQVEAAATVARSVVNERGARRSSDPEQPGARDAHG